MALGCLLFLCPIAQAGISQSKSHAVPRMEITPNPAFIDQPVKILLRDFPARQLVAVQLLTTNLLGQTWQSHAEFLTDGHGNADLAAQAPKSGTYRHADPAGLFWSLSSAGTNKVNHMMPLEPVRYKLTASVKGRTVATATIERFFLCPGVRQIQVRDHGLRGTLFLPAGKGPWPGVIVLGGSEGGLPYPPEAACLAAKGYAAFALAYFDYEDLPKSLENIPLEYFQAAIHWLQTRDDIRRNSIALLGGSRGGELALLLGATFLEVHAVVAISANSEVFGGLATNGKAPGQPAWTYQGKALPFWGGVKLTPDEKRELKQLSQTNSEADVFCFLAAVYKASIPVEKINGPVLLISGNNDIYNST
jgi:pimeloyl-ACP methyl ester carboxylesterase